MAESESGRRVGLLAGAALLWVLGAATASGAQSGNEASIEGPWVFTINGYAHRVEFHWSGSELAGSMEYGANMEPLANVRYASVAGDISFVRPLRAHGLDDQDYRGSLSGTKGSGNMSDRKRTVSWTAARPQGYRAPSVTSGSSEKGEGKGLYGQVTNSPGGGGIVGVRVLIGRLQLQTSNGGPVDTAVVTSLAADTMTDDQGNYKADVPAGTYDVVLWKQRFVPKRAQGITAPGRYNGTIGRDSMASSAHASLKLEKEKDGGGPRPTQPRNLALNRPARQSSISEFSKPNDAQGGVDGVKNGSFGFHTKRENHPWWQVDLGAISAIEEVRIFNRTDHNPERASTLMVRVSDNAITWKTVYRHDGTNPGGVSNPLKVRLANALARYVRVELGSPNEYLHLDEVEVYGIAAGSQP